MTALIVIGCILLFFTFILSLCVKITIEYNDEIKLYIRVLGIKITILPSKGKKKGPFSMSEKEAQKIREGLRKKAEKKKLKAQQKKAAKEQKKAQPKKKKSLSEILDIIVMVTDLAKTVIKRFFGHLHIDLARLNITVATGDAATTAIAYGAICDAVLHVFYVLEPLKGFDLPKTRDVNINTDYLSDEMVIDVKLTFSIRVGHVFHIAFSALGVLIKHLLAQKAEAQKKTQPSHKAFNKNNQKANKKVNKKTNHK